MPFVFRNHWLQGFEVVACDTQSKEGIEQQRIINIAREAESLTHKVTGRAVCASLERSCATALSSSIGDGHPVEFTALSYYYYCADGGLIFKCPQLDF